MSVFAIALSIHPDDHTHVAGIGSLETEKDVGVHIQCKVMELPQTREEFVEYLTSTGMAIWDKFQQAQLDPATKKGIVSLNAGY